MFADVLHITCNVCIHDLPVMYAHMHVTTYLAYVVYLFLDIGLYNQFINEA